MSTDDLVLDTIAARLENAASRKKGELRAQVEQRASEATKQANLVLRLASEAVEPAERDAAVRAIENLLAGWSSSQPRELEAELRKRRDELRSRQAPDADDFRERFGPTKVVLDGDQVELGFHFGAAYQGAWSAGEWVAEEQGWIARSESARESLRSYAGWPRLDLGPPIDLDAPLELSLTFELPADAPASQLVVVSVAGVNVALRGEQGSERARVQVTSGGAEGLRILLEQIERSGRGSSTSFAGFVRGEEYTLSIELSKKRSQALVRLWGKDAKGILSGETIADQGLPRTPERASSSSIVVRSLQPVRLLDAKLSVRAVPFY